MTRNFIFSGSNFYYISISDTPFELHVSGQLIQNASESFILPNFRYTCRVKWWQQARRRFFSFCFNLEKEPRVESFGGSKADYTAILTIFLLLNGIFQCQKKMHSPGKHRVRNTKHVYNRRFLGPCSVKSHRVYFSTYPKHSLSHNSRTV